MIRNIDFLSVSLTAIALCFFSVVVFLIFLTFANLGYEAGRMTCQDERAFRMQP